MVLERGFLTYPLNTDAMTDVPTLAAALVANFVTVRFPRMDLSQAEPPHGLPLARRVQRLTEALRIDRLIISGHRFRIRYELVEHGHSRFVDRIEADSSHTWRVHFFCLDEAAAVLIAKISGESCGPGTPVSFNPMQFVLTRLNKLQRWGQLERRYPWWDDDFE